jgi:acyl-CoA dehydrogenase
VISQIDLVKAKGAMKDIGMAKALIPRVVGEVIDRAIQVHGAEGICRSCLPSFLSVSFRLLIVIDIIFLGREQRINLWLLCGQE